MKSEAEPRAELFLVREGFQELALKLGPVAGSFIGEPPTTTIGGQSKAEGQKKTGTIGENPYPVPVLGMIWLKEEDPGAGAESWSPHLRPGGKLALVRELSQKHVRGCDLKREAHRVTKVKGPEAAMAAGIWSQESENGEVRAKIVVPG